MNQYRFILPTENVFKNVINTVCKMSAIVFMPRCFNVSPELIIIFAWLTHTTQTQHLPGTESLLSTFKDIYFRIIWSYELSAYSIRLWKLAVWICKVPVRSINLVCSTLQNGSIGFRIIAFWRRWYHLILPIFFRMRHWYCGKHTVAPVSWGGIVRLFFMPE